ncbi:phage tail protein [Xenophilus sp. AP218F]|nr:phage tail protein [Xenophilus sp. AP218F]
MPLFTPDFNEIRQTLLRDLQNLRADADVGPDSDYFVRASSVACAVEGLYQHQSWIARQIFPDTADRDYLEQHARIRGLTRKPAVAARGRLRLSGNAGAQSPLPLQLRIGEQLYATPAQDENGQPLRIALDAQGAAVVPLRAAAPGAAGNLPGETAAELMQAPAGLSSRAAVLDMSGGADEEDDAALLERLLDLIRRPPAGGNRHDYRRWALEVPGVHAAYVYPLRREPGTVDVVITAKNALPGQDLIRQVQARIDELRPVTASNSLVLAPTERAVDVVAALSLDGVGPAAFQPQLEAALAGFFAGLAPGERLVRSRLEALISDLPGVVDRQLISPAANVEPANDKDKVEWLRLGKVSTRGLA